MPRLIVHGFTISLAVPWLSCSSPEGKLDGEWSGRSVCRCQGETMIDDGLDGELHFEFRRDGTFRTWMDPNVEGAWGVNGVYRVESDSLIWKHDLVNSTWGGARILMMTKDSIVFEESPEKGCICTSHLRREHQQ
jgi:hypothetical protein